jgi:hypothetical protein
MSINSTVPYPRTSRKGRAEGRKKFQIKKKKKKRFQRKNFSKNTLFRVSLLKYICFEAGRYPCEKGAGRFGR